MYDTMRCTCCVVTTLDVDSGPILDVDSGPILDVDVGSSYIYTHNYYN